MFLANGAIAAAPLRIAPNGSGIFIPCVIEMIKNGSSLSQIKEKTHDDRFA